MKIATEVVRSEQQTAASYPCIKVSGDGRVVLFSAPQTGVFLAGTGHRIGDRLDTWAEDDFTVLSGRVILANEFG
jgi:hypothetical protein